MKYIIRIIKITNVKNFAYIILGVVFLFSFVNKNELNFDKGDGIQFSDMSFEDALKEAKSTNKLIFMDAYAAWCGPCKMMAKKTFTDSKVGEVFNENFINLKIDMEKGEGPALAKRYGVRAYPTLYFINGDGEVVHKIVGALGPDDFLERSAPALK